VTVVAALLVPDTALAPRRPALRAGYEAAAQALAQAAPDVLLVYSTRWIAVLDALWQTRARIAGTHVDEVWHDLGELPHDIAVDLDLARACIEGSRELGLHTKGVDYDAFPIDTGTVVATTLLGAVPPLVITASNIYHDAAMTERLGAMAAATAERQGKRAAVIGIGGLTREFHTTAVEDGADHVSRPEHDALNRELLALLEAGDTDAVRAFLAAIPEHVRVDQHLKHVSWLLGACGGIRGATVHAYGPDYGGGAAVVELAPAGGGNGAVRAGAPAVWRAAMRRPGRSATARSWSRPVR
jgi:2-aminophenol/2-amino-5-chlorophenol 1,6-dioxygenase alpha subunit